MPAIAAKPIITVDGNLSDWTADEIIDNPGNAVPGYTLYGTVENDTYFVAIQATAATDPVIGAGTTIWLNTDQNSATGYSPFDSIGADYNVTFDASGTPYLYTGAAGQTLVSSTPLTYALSPDGESLEIAIPRGLVTPAGGAAPTSINIAAELNNPGGNAANAVYLPGDYNDPEFTITDPATLPAATSTHKVAIVYSDTSANLYFSQTAYSDLFMAAQNQARMAGVSYDIIDESQLTDISNLVGYDAIIFPAMPDVNTADLPAIMSTLTSAVENYHIGIITAGDFLTNDQTGAPLSGNAYANMETLLGLQRYTGGNSGNVTVTADDVSNPIMQGYTSGQVIQSYTNEGYAAYQGTGGTSTDVLVNQNVAGVGTLPGVVETKTGGTNVHFASTDLLGDSNLLSHAIQTVALGTQPGVALHMSRDAGVVAVRVDMDQSQFPADVSPAAGGAGIYDTLIPILQQWNQQYDFVGSYYINIGDNPSGGDPSTTDWAKSLTYYKEILATGSEIGTHSYTHLINPPTTTITETTVGDTPAGSTQITLSALPAFAGVTVGMTVTGLNIGSNTPISGAAGEGGAVANTIVTAVSGNTITIGYVPGGYGTANDGVLGDIPAGTTLTFGVPAENTNFLQTGTGTVTGSNGDPFTYDYEFNQSKLLEEQELGTTIYGAAVPGANETYATDQNILPYFQSVAATATSGGSAGYVTGGWTGVGSGYPSAIGYMSPNDQGSLYIAPNMTFDFTEVQYEGKTVAQAEADWAAQFNALTSDAAGTPVVVLPVHDYGVAAWNTTTDTGTGSPYTTAMYTDFIAQAYADNYEFLTLEELAARTEAQQKASINYTTSGNTITATVTPDPTAPDLGGMALDVVNGGADVIQSVTNWYAYNAQELFLPKSGGTFTINLGTTQDNVTHIASLPMRGDLLACTGDGLDLSFSMLGTGQVVVDLGGTGTATPIVTGATIVSLTGNQLDLSLTAAGENDVTINLLARVTSVVLSSDTGSSATDFVTDIATQTISGTLSGPLGTGDVVQISLDDGATWLSATAAAAGTTFSLAGVTLAGSNTLIARVENSGGVSSTPLVQAYVLDQVPPQAPTTPDLVAVADSGASNTDNITNVATPTFTGTAESGSTVTLFDGTAAIGSAIATGGTWTITTTAALTNGGHSISATATDIAGNVSAASPALSLTIDTVAPVAPSTPDLTAASDTGKSNTDNITSITTPVFVGTAEAGSTVNLLDGTTVIGSSVATGGKWTITAAALAVGGHTIIATATDTAGNVSAASAALAVTIESSIAPPSVPDLVAGSDSGVSNTDNITKVVRPSFTGTAQVGSAVTLYDGTTAIGTANANATTGIWTITAATLANGTHSITAKATDAAGNTSLASGALSVTVDTLAPAAPTVPDLTAASDSGASNTDNITNVTKPSFTGTAEPGSTVTLYNGSASIGTAIAASSGDWSITSTAALTNGVHSISAKATDVAGNVSAASAALSVTIDTVIATPPRPDLVAASDSGLSNTDNITNVTTPTFTGTAAIGSTVSLFDGTAVIGSSVATAGTWTITTPTLADGAHSITARATDLAGNISAASTALSVTIDTVAPAAPKFVGGTASTLSGTGEAGATVTLLDGTSTVGTASVGAGGKWNWSFVGSSSLRALTVVEADKAGNVSPASGSVLIGTSGPDTLSASGSNQLLIGAAGADKFVFGANFGDDVIADFAATGLAHDVIDFHGSQVLNTFANVLSNTLQVGSGVVISDGSNTLTLNNVTKTSLTAADFTFV